MQLFARFRCPIPIVRAMILSVLPCLLSGCGGQTFNLTLQLERGNASLVKVDGEAPFVTVTNQGPGEVEVTFDSFDDWQDALVTLRESEAGRQLTGPGAQVLVQAGPREGAVVWIEAKRAERLVVGYVPVD